MINRKLRFGYDIGKGFVVGVEEMLQQFDRIGSMIHKNIAQELHRRAEDSRLDVIRSLGRKPSMTLFEHNIVACNKCNCFILHTCRVQCVPDLRGVRITYHTLAHST